METKVKKPAKPTKAALCKRAKFFKKLSKSDIAHLLETTDERFPTLAGFKRNRAHQLAHGHVCFDCRHIAIVLGLETVGGN